MRIEILQCENLPRLMVGVVDPYAVVVFEGFAVRTGSVRNERSPSWSADTPRAMRFPVTCPYSTVDIAINDEDLNHLSAGDYALGRVVVDLSQMRGRTIYDCWYPLQMDSHKGQHRSNPRSVRLRFSVQWRSDRLRMASYPRPPPTFVVPFLTSKALRNSIFAVKGKNKNPGQFDYHTFRSHLKDLRRFADSATRLSQAFFYWQYPWVSALAFIGTQLVISFPAEFLPMLPATILASFAASYPWQSPPHPITHSPIDCKLQACEMLGLFLVAHFSVAQAI